MIGLDTNVLVRYVMQDDPVQAALATRLIDRLTVDERGWIPLVSLVETVWVLGRSYRLTHHEQLKVVETLLRSRELIVEAADLVARALRRFEAGRADFADCLIVESARSAGCETTMTFDATAARDAGMSLLA
jgi:predicted nucleic-acid-binding protein